MVAFEPGTLLIIKNEPVSDNEENVVWRIRDIIFRVLDANLELTDGEERTVIEDDYLLWSPLAGPKGFMLPNNQVWINSY